MLRFRDSKDPKAGYFYFSKSDAGLAAEDLRKEVGGAGSKLDTNASDHKLSSHHAHARGNETIFASLVKQVHSMLLGLKVDRQAEGLRRINGAEGCTWSSSWSGRSRCLSGRQAL